MRWHVLLFVVLLAGCFGDDGKTTTPGDDPGQDPDPDDPTPDPAPPQVTPMLLGFGYHDCHGARTLYHATPEAAATKLPDGYSASEETSPSGPYVPVEYLFVQCSNLTTSGAVVPDLVYGSVSIAVHALANATPTDESWYRLRMFVSEDVMEQVWSVAEYEVYRGDFEQSRATGPLPLTTTTFGEYKQQGIEQGSAQRSVSVAYYTETSQGRLTWTGQVESGLAPIPAGTFDLPADDPFADSAGPGSSMFEQAVVTDGRYVGNDLYRS